MFLRGDNGFRVSSQLFHYFNLPYENPFEFDVINRIFSRVIILHYQYQSKSPSSQLLDFLFRCFIAQCGTNLLKRRWFSWDLYLLS